MYKYILFDMDGTLIDSKMSFKLSLEYALKKMKVENNVIEDINKFIGPTIFNTFKNVYDFNDEESQIAYSYYLEAYIDQGNIYKAELYDGVEKMIEIISQANCFTGVATTKSQENAKRIIKYHQLKIPLKRVFGTFRDQSRPNKAAVIKALMEENNIKKLDEVVMIGDRYTDIDGAKIIGIDSVGVTYGYGSKEELIESGADYIIDRPDELIEIILR